MIVFSKLAKALGGAIALGAAGKVGEEIADRTGAAAKAVDFAVGAFGTVGDAIVTLSGFSPPPAAPARSIGTIPASVAGAPESPARVPVRAEVPELGRGGGRSSMSQLPSSMVSPRPSSPSEVSPGLSAPMNAPMNPFSPLPSPRMPEMMEHFERREPHGRRRERGEGDGGGVEELEEVGCRVCGYPECVGGICPNCSTPCVEVVLEGTSRARTICPHEFAESSVLAGLGESVVVKECDTCARESRDFARHQREQALGWAERWGLGDATKATAPAVEDPQFLGHIYQAKKFYAALAGWMEQQTANLGFVDCGPRPMRGLFAGDASFRLAHAEWRNCVERQRVLHARIEQDRLALLGAGSGKAKRHANAALVALRSSLNTQVEKAKAGENKAILADLLAQQGALEAVAQQMITQPQAASVIALQDRLSAQAALGPASVLQVGSPLLATLARQTSAPGVDAAAVFLALWPATPSGAGGSPRVPVAAPVAAPVAPGIEEHVVEVAKEAADAARGHAEMAHEAAQAAQQPANAAQQAAVVAQQAANAAKDAAQAAQHPANAAKQAAIVAEQHATVAEHAAGATQSGTPTPAHVVLPWAAAEVEEEENLEDAAVLEDLLELSGDEDSTMSEALNMAGLSQDDTADLFGLAGAGWTPELLASTMEGERTSCDIGACDPL